MPDVLRVDLFVATRLTQNALSLCIPAICAFLQVLAAAVRYASEEMPLRVRFFREDGVDSLPAYAAAALQVAALGGVNNAAASAAAFCAHAGQIAQAASAPCSTAHR